jgi:hypothetical protein
MSKSARAELVEALSVSFSSLPKKKQPFDKLRASGDRFTSSSFGITLDARKRRAGVIPAHHILPCVPAALSKRGRRLTLMVWWIGPPTKEGSLCRIRSTRYQTGQSGFFRLLIERRTCLLTGISSPYKRIVSCKREGLLLEVRSTSFSGGSLPISAPPPP